MFVSKYKTTFYLYFKDENGKRIKVSTGCKTKSHAISFLQSFNKQEYKRKEHFRKVLFSTFYDEYFEYATGVFTPKTLRTYKCAFREAIRLIGDVPIDTITLKAVEQFASIKKNETSAWSARKYLICLASAFQKAIDWKIISENPFRKVKKPKTPEVLPTYLSPTEFNTLIRYIPNLELQDLIYTALLTGLRLAELRSLQWKDINFENRYIVVGNSDYFTTKNKRTRVVPMNTELLSRLTKRKQRVRFDCDWVFCNHRGAQISENTTSKIFKNYVKFAGINPKIHFHSLRHSYASALVKEGISLYAVQKLLGHRSIKTTEIYSHLSPEQLHKEVEVGLKSFSRCV